MCETKSYDKNQWSLSLKPIDLFILVFLSNKNEVGSTYPRFSILLEFDRLTHEPSSCHIVYDVAVTMFSDKFNPFDSFCLCVKNDLYMSACRVQLN